MKRKLFSIVVAVVMVIAMLPQMAFADTDIQVVSANPTVSIHTIADHTAGTAVDGQAGYTYTISTQSEMEDFIYYVNQKKLTTGITFSAAPLAGGASYEVTKVIAPVAAEDISSASTNSPVIKDSAKGFDGTFDGNKATFNLSISTGLSATGMFGYITAGGTVKALKTTGTVTGEVKCDAVGGVAGYNSGTIVNVTNAATVTADAAYNVGGIAGFNNGYYGAAHVGAITNSLNTGIVSGMAKVGGITGENSGNIDQCANTANISSPVSGKNGVGGIAGRAGNNNTPVETSVITNCYNMGDISCTDGKWVGGITGLLNTNSSCTNCYNTGNMSAVSYSDHIAGNCDGQTTKIVNCYGLAGVEGIQGFDEVPELDEKHMKSEAFLTEIKGSTTDIWEQTDAQYPNLKNCGVESAVTYTFGVTKDPKLTYQPDEHFSTAGMIVTAKGSDGSTAEIKSGFTVSNTDPLTVNDIDITVSGAYNGACFSFTFDILVGSKADTVTVGEGGTYATLEAAFAHVNANGTVYVMDTLDISGEKDYSKDDVVVARETTCTGPMFNISGGDVTFAGMTINSNSTGTVFNVSGGRLLLKGNIDIQNALTGVNVEQGASLVINKAVFQMESQSNYAVKVAGGSNPGKFELTDYGNISIEGSVYLGENAYIEIGATVLGTVTVESAVTTAGTAIAKGKNYTLTDTDFNRFSVTSGNIVLNTDENVIKFK